MTQATLYYFSGTGNTKALAQAAADALKAHGISVDVVNIGASVEYRLQELIGLFFPVYAFGAPRIVNRFLRRLPRGEGQRVFVVANAAETAGPAAWDVAAEFTAKGYQVVTADWVAMPSNYILGKGAITDGEAAETIERGRHKIMELVDKIMAGTAPATTPRWQPLHRLGYFAFMKGLKFMVRMYRASDKCIGCGACVEMCPVGAIDLPSNNRPVWNRGCEHCMRCVNFCPVDAIEVGRFTVGKKRYKYWQGKV